MDNFWEEQLDPLITQGCQSKVQWKRIKIYTESGKLTQRFLWTRPKHWIDLAYRPRPAEEYQALLDFFMIVMEGAYTGFRVKDWSDFELTATNSTLTFISGSDWQIQRKHAKGAKTALRVIKKPVVDSVTILNEVGTDVGASIDYETGIATIAGSSDGDIYTATGEFDLPMTFKDDEWTTNLMVSTQDLWLSPEPIMLEGLIL